jgi:hypothetical protein
MHEKKLKGITLLYLIPMYYSTGISSEVDNALKESYVD